MYTYGTGTTLHILYKQNKGKAYNNKQQTTHITLQIHTQQSEACSWLQLEAGGRPVQIEKHVIKCRFD